MQTDKFTSCTHLLWYFVILATIYLQKVEGGIYYRIYGTNYCTTIKSDQTVCLFSTNHHIRLINSEAWKKRCFLPFSDQPKISENLGCFFSDVQCCIFKQNCYNEIFKMHCNCPNIYCVGTEGICVYTIHISIRLFDVTYLNTENYMIYTAFLQHPD